MSKNKRDRCIYGPGGKQQANLEPTLAKEMVQSRCNAIKSKLLPNGDVIMTATSLGAG